MGPSKVVNDAVQRTHAIFDQVRGPSLQIPPDNRQHDDAENGDDAFDPAYWLGGENSKSDW